MSFCGFFHRDGGNTLHGLHVLVKCLFFEGFYGSILDVVYGNAELQVLKRGMLADIGECFGKVFGLCVGGEGLDY